MVRKCQLLRCFYVGISFIILPGQNVHTAAQAGISEADDDGEEDRRLQSVSMLQAQLEQDISKHKCALETGALSSAHEAVLERLNGKKLVYIGDCLTRCASFTICILAAEFCLRAFSQLSLP